MTRHVIIGVIILCIMVSLFAIIPISMKQNGDQKMTNNTLPPHVSLSPEVPHFPEEWVIASFGMDEKNPGRLVFLKNPVLMDAFINTAKADTVTQKYQKRLVNGYVKDRDGSIVVLMNPNEWVNQTVVNEVYSNISALGRKFNITSVPCKFVRMDIVDIDIRAQEQPPVKSMHT